MELAREQQYAVAALFTLAIHDVSVEDASSSSLWGEPPGEEALDGDVRLAPREWDHYWGWDLIANGGLLDSVYAGLGVPRHKWPGLKRLPLAGCAGGVGAPERAPLEVIRSFVGVVDAQLAASLPALLRRPSRRAQQQQQQQQQDGRVAEDGLPAAAPNVDFTLSKASTLMPAERDEQQAGSPAASCSLGSTPRAEPRPVRDDLWEGLLSSSDDSDFEEDMRREGLYMPAAALRHEAHLAPGMEGLQLDQQPEAAAEGEWDSELLPEAASCDAAQQAGKGGGDSQHSRGQPVEQEARAAAEQASGAAAEQASGPAAEQAPGGQAPKPVPTSAHALGALWELVQCCIGVQPLPGAPAEDATHMASGPAADTGGSAAPGKPDESGMGGGSSKAAAAAGADGSEFGGAAVEGEAVEGAEAVPPGEQPLIPAEAEQPCARAPQVQWYDARARVALKQVAAWLQVPWRKVANFEMLLASEKCPASDKEAAAASAAATAKAGPSSWEQRLRWVKVGAAAVGGGALFAVTGGLAAPALAAGLGSVITMAGGSAAVAGAVTTFGASATGLAAVTATAGAAGAATTGSRMAHRTSGVTEFGFRELVPPRPAPSSGSSSSISAAAQPTTTPAPSSVVGQEVGGSSAAGGSPAAAEARGSEREPNEAAAGGGTAGQADGGHLLCSPTKAASVQRWGTPPDQAASTLPEAPAGGGSNSANATAASTAKAAPVSKAEGSDAGEPSAWQRWFGRKGEPPPLLPVPLRVRSSGDVRPAALICVSGWITEPEDYAAQWEGASAPEWSDADQFSLVWESRELLALNSALGSLVAKQAGSQAAQFAVNHFFFAAGGLVSALAPALLLDTATGLLIGNTWAICMERSVKAGKLLAHVLMSGGHGGRPVTLVGHSLGARVIFHCLLELCRHNCRGVVQDAVLLGAPVGTRPERWRMARRAVAGRLVNGYTSRDWLLAVVYSGASAFFRAAAGLCAIEGAPGVQSVNLTALVSGHFNYLEELPEVLDAVALWD